MSDEMNDWLKTLAAVLAPDLAIAWAVMKLGDGAESTFWWTLAILWGVSLFFWFKSLLARWVLYRVWGKARLAELARNFLRQNGFPTPEPGDDIDRYFWRVVEDEKLPVRLRLLACAEATRIEMLGQQGMLPALRAKRAYNDVLRHYHA